MARACRAQTAPATWRTVTGACEGVYRARRGGEACGAAFLASTREIAGWSWWSIGANRRAQLEAQRRPGRLAMTRRGGRDGADISAG